MEIFVFGSNLLGIHGAGAAYAARLRYGAELGVGVGRTGMSYAIPTKRTPSESLSLFEIARHVADFIEYARQHPELKFVVTKIGCGLAGYTSEQIAPMFKGAPNNCQFSEDWLSFIRSNENGCD